jgi:hypothetical protein
MIIGSSLSDSVVGLLQQKAANMLSLAAGWRFCEQKANPCQGW